MISNFCAFNFNCHLSVNLAREDKDVSENSGWVTTGLLRFTEDCNAQSPTLVKEY